MNYGKTDIKLIRFASLTIAFILVLLPFHAFFTSWAANNFGHLDIFRLWKEVLIVILVPPALYLGWQNPKTKIFLKKSWVVRLFLLYIALHLILGFWALHSKQVNKTALAYSLLINLRFIGFFLITYLVAANNNYLKKNVSRIIIIPAIIVIAVGLLQKIVLPHNLLGYFYGKGTIPPYQTIDGNENLKRIQSTLRGANPLGAYLVLALTATAAFVKGRLYRDGALLCGAIVLFYSYSRSAWLGLVISMWLLAWWMILKRHHRTWLLSSLVIGLIIIGGMFYLFKSDPTAQDTLLHTSNSSKSKMSSNEARRIALKNGFDDVMHQPLGDGPGTAGPASFRNKPHHTRIAENYFLQLGQEVGVLGMGIFVAINVLVAAELWRIRNQLLAKFLLASFAGITFINLISHAWTDDTLSLIWWGVAGICLAPVIKVASQRAPKAVKK